MAYIVDATVRSGGDFVVRHIGKFDGVEEAVRAAEEVIDAILREHRRAGMAPRELFARYEEAGVFPYIFLDHDENTFNLRSFNHYQYALKRCSEFCGERTAPGGG